MCSASISLVIPSFNMALYIADAIDSALAQTRPFAQIIVVDDGSTDETSAVLARYGSQIEVIQQENMGVSVARNTGVAAAAGTFLAFLDADDLLLPNRLERQMAVFDAAPETQFCDALADYFWCPLMSQAQHHKDHRWAEPFWRKSYPGHISTWLMRRDVMTAVGPFEPGRAYSEDTDWRLRCKSLGLISGRLEEQVSRRRLHTSNATNRNRQGNVKGLLWAIRRHRSRNKQETHEPST